MDEESEGESLNTGILAPEKIDTKYLFDNSLVFLEVEAALRGGTVYRNKDTGFWHIKVPKDARPRMNDKGIRDVMAYLRGNASIVQGSSIWREERILQWIRRIGLDLLYLLHVNAQEYELESSNYYPITSMILYNIEANARKGLDGTALKLVTQSERQITTKTQDLTENVSFLKRLVG